jgi:hypothetical protein
MEGANDPQKRWRQIGATLSPVDTQCPFSEIAMDLQDFVAQSLSQLARGIIRANELLKDTNAKVPPANIYPLGTDQKAFGQLTERNEQLPIVHLVEFDVAVQVVETGEKSGGINLGIAVVGIAGKGKSEHTQSSDSRIRFGIPVVLPSS